MNLLDALPIVLIVGYGVLGFFSGIVRRIIGLVALYIAFLAANNMGLQAGGIMQQSSSLDIQDGRIYGFFGIAVAVLLLFEGAAQLAHRQIQIEAMVLNRATGAIVGVVTGLLLAVVVTHELIAAGSPFGGGQLNGLQTRIHDATQGSKVAVPLYQAIGKPIVAVFQPVLPSDPQIYFSSGPVT
jgi:hypothetical protein